ncbi:hypothetical protein [Raoultella terrigena]|nr:hypothetical protein [Raoultella terrigena]
MAAAFFTPLFFADARRRCPTMRHDGAQNASFYQTSSPRQR